MKGCNINVITSQFISHDGRHALESVDTTSIRGCSHVPDVEVCHALLLLLFTNFDRPPSWMSSKVWYADMVE